MVISRFRNRDVDNVIRRANNTEFLLASGLMTKDLSKALYVSERLEAGTCFVNTYNKTDVAAPFGGFKQSGFGKEDIYIYIKLVVFVPLYTQCKVFGNDRNERNIFNIYLSCARACFVPWIPNTYFLRSSSDKNISNLHSTVRGLVYGRYT